MKPGSERQKGSAGQLYVVATPIGNLTDLTERAGLVLAQADLVAAEDTRRTRKILSRLGVRTRLVSYREENQARAGARLIKALQAGQDVALATDAGTPALSDPGHRLVRAAHAAGIEVVAVPGPSALAAALSASGLPADRFFFGGFPPAQKGPRQRFFETWARMGETLVFYETPHRLAASLEAMSKALGPREAVLCRELTKINEEVRFSTLAELAAWAQEIRVKGEVTLVVAGASEKARPPEPEVIRQVWQEKRRQGLSPSQAAREAARHLGLPRAYVYRVALDGEP